MIVTLFLFVFATVLFLLLFKDYNDEVQLKVKTITEIQITKIIEQVLGFLLVLNGLDFIPHLPILGTALESIQYLDDNISELWKSVSQVISFGIGIAQILGLSTKDSVHANFARIIKMKSVSASSGQRTSEYLREKAKAA